MTILILENDIEKAENLRQKLQLFDESLLVEVINEPLENVYQNLKNLYQIEPFNGFKTRFIVRKGENFHVISVQEIAYIFTEARLVFLVDKAGNKYILEKSLSELEISLSPQHFFRVNRKFIVNIDAIKSFKPSFKGKISLELVHLSKAEVSISQENATDFKRWIEN